MCLKHRLSNNVNKKARAYKSIIKGTRIGKRRQAYNETGDTKTGDTETGEDIRGMLIAEDEAAEALLFQLNAFA